MGDWDGMVGDILVSPGVTVSMGTRARGDKNRVTPWWHLWVTWGHCDHGDKGWGDRDVGTRGDTALCQLGSL